MENKKQLKVQNNQLITKSEVESKLNILVEGQTNNSKQLQEIRNDLQKGFIGLALRNEQLLRSNDQLKQQLNEVLNELNRIKQEREEKLVKKKARANRKRLPKRDPMTAQIYKELMKETEGPHLFTCKIKTCSLSSGCYWCTHQRTLKYQGISTENINSRIVDCH